MGFVDLRSKKEKQMERRARKELNSDDEEIAKKLLILIQKALSLYEVNRKAYNETRSDIREIGYDLCENGGSDRMLLIAYRVEALGGKIRNLELFWNGICGWMF